MNSEEYDYNNFNNKDHNEDHNDIVEIYKGKYFEKPKRSRAKKVVVFDLDETLGSFIDLEILWRLLDNYKHSFSIDFNDLLNLYPEFIRYGILSILEYLKCKKKSGECHKLYVYTNNRAEKSWTQSIVNYFNRKISKRNILFDQIIYAFKINNVHVEPGRTTTKKTHDDFIRCTLLPKTTTICFIDDVNYKDMQKERIYYIKPMAYHHHLSSNEIINRFIYSKFGELLLQTDSKKYAFKSDYIERVIKSGSYKTDSRVTNRVLENDILVSQKIMYHIREYFVLTNKKSKTCKRKYPSFRFTRKHLL
jgi:hypothetical protein